MPTLDGESFIMNSNQTAQWSISAAVHKKSSLLPAPPPFYFQGDEHQSFYCFQKRLQVLGTSDNRHTSQGAGTTINTGNARVWLAKSLYKLVKGLHLLCSLDCLEWMDGYLFHSPHLPKSIHGQILVTVLIQRFNAVFSYKFNKSLGDC